MSSSFIEDAAREAAEASILPGDPAAGALLAEARRRIYHWPADFAGFTCELGLTSGSRQEQGTLRCEGSRRLTVSIEASKDARWLRFQLEELTSHREAPEVSKMASPTGCALGDWDPIYGRRVDFLGDKMGSYYRLKDAQLRQIGRCYKNQRFVINIDQLQSCDGRWAASFYTAYYWSAAGEGLVKTETYLDDYQSVEGIYLPVRRRVTEAGSSTLVTRELLFTNHRLLSAEAS